MTARVTPRRRVFWLSCVVALVADQFTKLVVYDHLLESRPLTVIPGFLFLQRAENSRN